MGQYRQWLECKVPGEVAKMNDLSEILAISGVLTREEWYGRLASVNYNITRLRDKITRQKEIILQIEREDVLEMACETLALMQETLRLFEQRQRFLLSKLRLFPLPPRTKVELDCVAIHGDYNGHAIDRVWEEKLNGEACYDSIRASKEQKGTEQASG